MVSDLQRKAATALCLHKAPQRGRQQPEVVGFFAHARLRVVQHTPHLCGCGITMINAASEYECLFIRS